jgi:hypothetical protein
VEISTSLPKPRLGTREIFPLAHAAALTCGLDFTPYALPFEAPAPGLLGRGGYSEAVPAVARGRRRGPVGRPKVR